MLLLWFKRIFLSLFMVLISQASYAGPKTLIKYKGGKITPALATSAKKLSEGKYEFKLSTGITPAMVQKSLQKKLKKFSGKVQAKGAAAVIVTFSGDEKKFLKKVSKTRIKTGASASLAVESSVSDGGIRAKTSERGPAKGEVKGQVLQVKGDTIKMIVTTAGEGTAAKNGRVITVSGRGSFNPKRKDIIFFKQISSNPWKGKDFTDK